MATPIDPANVQDFDQPLNDTPDFTSSHVFSTADITGSFDGKTQGVDGDIVDLSGANGTMETKEGVTLYPIDSEFGFEVTDFVGAEEKVLDGDYSEGWAGDLIIDGQQAGLVISNSETDTFKTPALLGTWLSGLGGNTVKASTEHYSVMQAVLSDQKFPDDPDATYALDDNLILLSQNEAYDGQYVQDLLNGTAMFEGQAVTVEDVNLDGVLDIKDLLNPNESTIEYDIAYGDDYSVTMKDDGKLLYRWGNAIKRPNDVRVEAHLETPDEWNEIDQSNDLKKLYQITSAELVVHHTITNNPNDQVRPEDFENESAIGTLPTYEIIEDYNGEAGRTVWATTDDYYAGDGTLYEAGTILRDSALADAAAGSTLASIGAASSDVELGFTNAWYTTMDREPFEPVLNEDGTEYVTGPRWRLQPDKYGQDLPSVTIPTDPSTEPPVQNGEEKYEVGAETQTVLNLLDWGTDISPLSISAGWQDKCGTVSVNGVNMTEDFDVAVYVKGDIKPATIYSTELLVDYEEIAIHDADSSIVGTAADDYLVGVGNNTFTGGDGSDLFVLSYGTSETDVITQNVVADFEVGKDKLGFIGFDAMKDFDPETVAGKAMVEQSVSGDDLQISISGELVATLTGVAADLDMGASYDAGEGLNLLDSFFVSNPGEGVLPGSTVGTAVADVLYGTVDDDVIYGMSGNDSIYGLAGKDLLFGGEGDDYIKAGLGADTVYGGDGDDLLLGLAGTDILVGDAGDDVLKGGRGQDTLIGLDDNDLLMGGSGDDVLKGGTGDDVLEGGDDDDQLFGNAGRDVLLGEEGNDTLNGGRGVDALDGGLGDDVLTGGVGADTFHFDVDGANDVITDFDILDDTLALSSALVGGETDTAVIVSTYAAVAGSDVVMDFGGGDIVTLEGLATTVGLSDAIDVSLAMM